MITKLEYDTTRSDIWHVSEDPGHLIIINTGTQGHIGNVDGCCSGGLKFFNPLTNFPTGNFYG